RALDEHERSDDPAVRQHAEDFTALMTPIVKALFTDLGFEAANLGVQVYGGHGYIRDHGMEQYVRDARIAMIYEGTNGIQALDLIGRKMPAHAGRYLRTFFHPVSAFIEAKKGDAQLGPLVQALERAFGALQLATAHIAQAALRDPEEAGAAAVEYLRLFGLVALGFMWARTAEIALAKARQANGDSGFYRNKLTTARFYMERILPQTAGLYLAIKSGKQAMMELEEAAF
ncbi:MAG: acyl-CoA dehydrogenase C-terminal domain-containing protein, partial [Acetobacteraceae bacterium]|nr:acyl-CoA dehydrogenase C-terminal domain-containing protein [Acetobacteraceae bacterium]